MGIKVSAGLSSHLNALRKNPRPGLRLLAASTQFLAAVGLRCSVPAGCQQGALSERVQAPPIPSHGPPPPSSGLGVCPALLVPQAAPGGAPAQQSCRAPSHPLTPCPL